jgi:branched-chain amino acid transport system permease protein
MSDVIARWAGGGESRSRLAGAVGGAVVILGALLPWAAVVFPRGAYPDKSTLAFFPAPFATTGFRWHLLLFGVLALVLSFIHLPGGRRALRVTGWAVIVIALVNAGYILGEGGWAGLSVGGLVAAAGGVAIAYGEHLAPVEPLPVRDWRLSRPLEWLVLVLAFAGLLFLVAALLTAGGIGVTNPFSGAVFLSMLAASGGLLGVLHGTGLMGWISAVSERHRLFSVLVLLVVALVLPLTAAGTEYWMQVACNIGIYAATAIGLNIVVGLAGLLDLGYVAFLGIGSFVAANLSGAASAKLGIQLPFPLVMVICAVVAGTFGAIVGSPTLRVRGDYLAIVTLAFGEIFVRSAQNDIGGLTGGPNAIPNIPQVEVFGTELNSSLRIGAVTLPAGALYYVLIVLLVAGVMLVFGNLKNSRLGRAWIAIREDEDAAAAMGIRTGPTKILAFVLGAVLAGLAGAFFAHKTATVSYESFRFLESVTLLAAVILGGMGTIPGAVLGASLLFVLPEKLREFSDYRLLLFGLALIVIMRFRPQGLVPDEHRRAELVEDPGDQPAPATRVTA